MDEPTFEQRFNGSPVRRAGYMGLLRNVAIAIGNSGALQLLPQLERWCDAEDVGLRSAARWATNKVRSKIDSHR